MSGEMRVDREALGEAVSALLYRMGLRSGDLAVYDHAYCEQAADAVLAILPAPHPGDEYPPLPTEATVESLWKSLNDLHEYAMEAIAAEKACAAAATEAHINGVCAPAPQETLRDALADLLPFASTSLAHDMDEGVEVGALYEDEPPDARHSVGYHRPDCRLCAAVSNVHALLAAAPAPTEAGDPYCICGGGADHDDDCPRADEAGEGE